MRRRSCLVGNWKMHGLSADLAVIRRIDDLASAAGVEVALALPFTLIARAAQQVSTIAIGAQTCNALPAGAYTGEVSCAMLADAGATCVILGHSERREMFAETSAMVRDKAGAALDHGLGVILCVGEHRAEREAGVAEATVCAQMLTSLPRSIDAGARLTIAYEPVWSIGTGDVPNKAMIAAMHTALRNALAGAVPGGEGFRILYGGSVNPGNAGDILGLADVDGALIGHASLDVESFAAILSMMPGG